MKVLVGYFLRAALLALVSAATLVPAGAANADSIGGIDYRWINLNQTCGANSWKTVRTNVYVDPLDWDKPWWYIYSTHDAAGYFKTDIYVKNSFRRADVARVCKSGHLYRVWMPDIHVHKKRYVNFNCAAMSCRWMYTKTTGWMSGYCMKSFDARGNPYANCY